MKGRIEREVDYKSEIKERGLKAFFVKPARPSQQKGTKISIFSQHLQGQRSLVEQKSILCAMLISVHLHRNIL